MKLLDILFEKQAEPNPISFDRNFPYGKGCSERLIEIPWALSKYAGEKRVLETGCSFAEDEYIDKLKLLQIPLLYGIDISDKNAKDFIKKTADIRDSGFPSGYFEMILCISTIEHVGMDNKKHYSPIHELANAEHVSPDVHALREMWRILKKGGKLIVTVPFGKYHDYGWFKHYNAAALTKLTESVDYARLIKEFFMYTPEGWTSCAEADLANSLYNDNGAVAAAGLCCCLFVK